MELGVAYFLTHEYQLAFQHYEGFIRKHPHHADIIYGMAGTALWCLDQRLNAIQMWRDGLRCRYSDAAGGISNLLMLYCASIVDPSVEETTKIKQTLAVKIQDPRADTWPGPLARYVLGRIDEDRLQAECADFNVGEAETRKVEVSFYNELRKSYSHDPNHFVSEMRRISKMSWNDYLISKHVFFGKVWRPTFHLARHFAKHSALSW